MGRLKEFFVRIIDFFRFRIWEISDAELTTFQSFTYRFFKILILAIRGFIADKLVIRASALTYSILFALVPFIALIMAIAKGFGVEALIETALEKSVITQPDAVPVIMGFIERYLKTAQGGIFIGVGLVVLLWSVMSFLRNVEGSFNNIWQVKKSRSIGRQFSTYFSFILIIPILIVFSSGFSIFVNAAVSHSYVYDVLNPLMRFGVKFTPYIANWLVFSVLFALIPNTRVRFNHALFAGFITGTLFQIFQLFYIHGQVLLSRYNVVYGGFAAIPLLFLWLQISCLIVLLGAEISFTSQNIHNFDYEMDTNNISTRYKNFLTLFICHLIIKRFENQESAFTSDQIAMNYKLPIRLVNQIIAKLVEVKILIEVVSETSKTKTYLPAFDINKLTVGLLFSKLEKHGSEMFLKTKNDQLDAFWQKTLELKEISDFHLNEILVKDV